MAENEVNVKFGAEINGFTEGVESIKEKLEGLNGPIKVVAESFGGLGEAVMAAFAFNELKEAFEALAEPFEKVAEWAEQMGELGEKAVVASQMIGMSVQQLTEWQFAASMVGVNSEAMTHALERLERSMAMSQKGTGAQAQAFKSLDISVKDSEGNLKSVSDIVGQIAEKFSETADGPTKTAVAMQLFGRAGAEMIPILDQGKEGLDELKAKAAELGVTMDDTRAHAFMESADALKEMHAAATGLSETLFSYFEPAIVAVIHGVTDLLTSINNASKESSALHDVWTALVLVIDTLVAAVALLSSSIQALWQVIAAVTEGIVTSLTTIGNVLEDLVTGHFGRAKEDLVKGLDELNTIISERAEKFAKIAEGYADTIKTLFRNVGEAGVSSAKPEEVQKPKPTEQLHFDPSGGGKADDKEFKYKLAMLDMEIAAYKNNYDMQLQLEDEKLALIKAKYGEESYEYQNELRKREDMVEKHTELVARMQLEADNTQREIQTIGLEEYKKNLDAEVAQGAITNSEKIEQLKEYYRQVHDLQLQGLEEQLKMPGLNPEQVQKINDQILVLQAKYNSQIADINAQGATESAKEWQQAFQPIGQAFDGLVSTILQGNQSIEQAALRAASQMAQAYIKMAVEAAERWAWSELMRTTATQAGNAQRSASNMAADASANAGILTRVARWIAGELGMTTATETQDAARTAEQATQDTVAKTSAILSNTMQAQSYAAVGATAAGASAAAIPIIGPELAPEAAASTYAALEAFAGLASAEGGWSEVPEDGVITELHKKEMVLPASIADPLRQAIPMISASLPTSSYSSGQMGGEGGGVHLNYAPVLNHNGRGPMSKQEAQRFYASHGDVMMQYLANARRNGRI